MANLNNIFPLFRLISLKDVDSVYPPSTAYFDSDSIS